MSMYRLLLTAILVLSLPAFSQDCTTSVVVNAFDFRLGVDIQTLKADDFKARMDGTPLEIVNLRQGYNSRLLVLLETDGAQDNEKVSEVVDTVTRMARQAPEGKPVAFGVYAARAEFTKGFFADQEKRTAEINAIVEQANSLGKRVALFDALHQALSMFGEHQPGDTILLVGVPYDDKSSHSVADIEKEFLATGTRLMVMFREQISHTYRDFMWNTHRPERRLFSDVPGETGGADSAFDPHFFGFTWRGYLMELRLPESVRKPQKWQMKLQQNIPHSKLYYPQVLSPCRVASTEKGNE